MVALEGFLLDVLARFNGCLYICTIELIAGESLLFQMPHGGANNPNRSLRIHADVNDRANNSIFGRRFVSRCLAENLISFDELSRSVPDVSSLGDRIRQVREWHIEAPHQALVMRPWPWASEVVPV